MADDAAYRCFGVTFATGLPLSSRLCGSADDVTLSFAVTPDPPFGEDVQSPRPIYASSEHTPDGNERLAYAYRLPTCDVLRFTGVADYYLWADRVACYLYDPVDHPMVELFFLSTVLSFWLERQGVPTLHASAAVVQRCVAGFLSGAGDGKSGLAATLMQAGHPLLTDDILPVERQGNTFLGRPGYPTMRMWPDEAQHFLGHYEDLPRVHPKLEKRRVFVGPDGFGTFHDQSVPLACLYLSQRRDPAEWGTRVEITPVSPRDAVIELVRHSFVPRVVEAIGLQPQRLEFFAQLALQVPMRRLVYPSGFQHLPRVRDAVLEDLART